MTVASPQKPSHWRTASDGTGAVGLLEVSLDILVARMRQARSEVAFASPYNSADVGEILAGAVPRAVEARRLLTAVEPAQVQRGSLDVDGRRGQAGGGASA
jgi:hypothetical protein